MLTNLISIIVPLPVTLATSFLKPSEFDWKEFLRIKKVSGVTTPHHQTKHTVPTSNEGEYEAHVQSCSVLGCCHGIRERLALVFADVQRKDIT